MQKVYLLLRNNQQTGPHSLEELLQLGLKPFDLVWVEGKSYGWAYPSEIENLKPFLPTSLTPGGAQEAREKEAGREVSPKGMPAPLPHKHIFVSLPAGKGETAPLLTPTPVNSLEERAEALRARAQSFTPAPPPPEDEVKTHYRKDLSAVEEDYTSWIYRKKTKRKTIGNKKMVVAAGLALGLLAGVWWGLHREPKTLPLPTQTAQQPRESQPSSPEMATTPVFTDPAPLPRQGQTSPADRIPGRRRDKKVNGQKNAATGTPPTGLKTLARTAASVPVPVAPEEKSQPVVAVEKKDPAPQTPTKEKRTLRTLFGSLFKKNKKEVAATEDPQPADNQNNQRNATRREDPEASVASSIDLSDRVTVSMNKSSSDWMMGVQDLKLTLSNRSTSLLKSAQVEVRYYSDDNTLLDKKTLSFVNLAPGKSQTLAAPDHRTADHADYKILAAQGVANAYVKE
ncbi:MAG: hypothetical protein ACXVML_14610 [Flavisolibacter sp.]